MYKNINNNNDKKIWYFKSNHDHFQLRNKNLNIILICKLIYFVKKYILYIKWVLSFNYD